MDIKWAVSDDGTLFYWCNISDTMDIDVHLSGKQWMWTGRIYEDASGENVLAYADGYCDTKDEALVAAEVWARA